MDRVKLASDKHAKGYNCAQAVLCAFCDKTNLTEDELFRISEAFGAGMGGNQSVCGAVSAMVFLVGLVNSRGIACLPETNKIKSYQKAREMIDEFEQMNKSVICKTLKSDGFRSCSGCIEDAVKIIEKRLF